MMINKQQASITAIVALVVGLGASVATVEAWWPRIGWETPNNHKSDIENQAKAIGVLSDQIRCRRWEVELEALYAQVNDGNQSIRLRDRITRHRRVMDDQMCNRFGNY